MKCSGEQKTCNIQLRENRPHCGGELPGSLPRKPEGLHANRLLGHRNQPLLRLDEAVEKLHGLPASIASTAAMNGNGSDTAARSQTMRGGIIGISHITSRWIAYSAQAVE